MSGKTTSKSNSIKILLRSVKMYARATLGVNKTINWEIMECAANENMAPSSMVRLQLF